jgi:hypothetical protein
MSQRMGLILYHFPGISPDSFDNIKNLTVPQQQFLVSWLEWAGKIKMHNEDPQE